MISIPVSSENLEQRLLRELHAALAHEIQKITETVISDAHATFEKEIRAKLGIAAINLANYYTVERIGGNLVITVRLEGAK